MGASPVSAWAASQRPSRRRSAQAGDGTAPMIPWRQPHSSSSPLFPTQLYCRSLPAGPGDKVGQVVSQVDASAAFHTYAVDWNAISITGGCGCGCGCGCGGQCWGTPLPAVGWQLTPRAGIPGAAPWLRPQPATTRPASSFAPPSSPVNLCSQHRRRDHGGLHHAGARSGRGLVHHQGRQPGAL